MQRLTLGFDARLHASAYVDQVWGTVRRENFLLRPEIAWPKSIDKTVWPAVLRLPGDVDMGAQGVIDVEPIDVRQNALDVWRDLDSLERALNRQGVNGHGRVVMITVLTEEAMPSDHVWMFAIEDPAQTTDTADEWEFLGYDVADASMTSALMNCGFQPSERDALRKEWADRLNAHGLFQSLDDARAFRLLNDARVAEHAPFFVFAFHARLHAG